MTLTEIDHTLSCEERTDSKTPRLLDGLDPEWRAKSLVDHRRLYTAPHQSPVTGSELIQAIADAGLRGRGGASFPTAIKLNAVRGQSTPHVVVNATEGEPASIKDRLLCVAMPHLVLDGALLVARALGSNDITICIARDSQNAIDAMHHAIAQCQRSEPTPTIRLMSSPTHFVAGEETALVHWINGHEAKPTGGRPFINGVDGRSTLVENAETLAHLTWIHRFGPGEFCRSGTGSEPGTMLATVTRVDRSRTVVEVPIGTSIETIASLGGASVNDSSAVLVGGYFGAWLGAQEARGLAMSNDALRPFGASMGCGVVAPLPFNVCGWCETARLMTWMAGESAGQCGPCVNGLSAIAEAVRQLALGEPPLNARDLLHRWANQIDGRGGCRFPDGAVRLLRSALRVHSEMIDAHIAHHGCPMGSPTWLPIPDHRRNPWR